MSRLPRLYAASVQRLRVLLMHIACLEREMQRPNSISTSEENAAAHRLMRYLT